MARCDHLLYMTSDHRMTLPSTLMATTTTKYTSPKTGCTYNIQVSAYNYKEDPCMLLQCLAH